jgi:hypothetical protein
MKSKKTTIFTTTIDKIDWILKDKDFQSEYDTENAENKQLIVQNILKKYQKFRDVFLKKASDELAVY